MIRNGILQTAVVDSHTHHCLNLLRQAILCASDTTLDPINYMGDSGEPATDGVGTLHVCRDWQAVYDFVTENQRSALWDKPKNATI